MTRASVLLAACAALCACGGDDAPPGGGGGGLRPVPDAWADGDRFAVAMLSHQTEDPRTLLDPVCRITAQVASAAGSTGLPVSDREGDCLVTTADSLDDVGAGLEAECGGDLGFRFGGMSRLVGTCAETLAAPFDVPCDAVDPASDLRVTADGMGMLAAFDVTLPRPELPVIHTPMPSPGGTSVWPEGGGDLQVGWSSGTGDTVEVVIQATSGGPAVRCISADDGTLTVPARLLTTLRSSTASLEVARISQETVDAGGIPVRASFSVSSAIHLFAR